MRYYPRITATIALVLAMAAPASAQSQADFKFVRGSGKVAFGVQVGTYKAELDGKGIDVWCVDFMNHISPGNRFKVNATKLDGTVGLGTTRFGSTKGLARYQQAAWLAAQFRTTAVAQWGFIHAAIWQLMTPTSPWLTLPSDIAAVQGWTNLSAANYQKYVYNNVYVLTDVAVAGCAGARPTRGPWNGCGKQEQLYIRGDLTLAPEPATMGLLATGLVGLGGATFLRRRRQAKS